MFSMSCSPPLDAIGRGWSILMIRPSIPIRCGSSVPGRNTSASPALAWACRISWWWTGSPEASRAELAASRARIGTAADQTRRRIERDLHDGVQQRLVSLALAQRGAEAMVPPELPELQEQLSRVADGLAGALEELQEISRGIQPAILARGRLAAALKAPAPQS